MWKTQLNRSIKELRFVIKQAPEHHGVLHWTTTKLPDVRVLNQNTFFSFTEITEDFESNSACHVLYGDHENSGEEVLTGGLTSEQFEEILKSKVAHGLSLPRNSPVDNTQRSIPLEIVEARKHVYHMDDAF